MDPYAVLGLARDATPEAIKDAFRRASKRTHPDHGGSAAAFDQVKRAHVVLIDPDSRAHFDATGERRDKPADPDQGAWGLIARMLTAIVDAGQADHLTQDLVKAMGEQLKDEIKKTAKSVEAIERALAHAEKLKGRFAPKEGGALNVVERMIEHRATELKRMREGAERQIALAERAMQLLDGYSFRADHKQSLVISNETNRLFGVPFGSTSSSSTGW